MRVHLTSLGCRLNEAELENWSRGFQSQGHQITRQIDDAGLVVMNTCAVTSEAVKKSRKLMRRVHAQNPRAKLVVSGCYVSLDPAEIAQSLGVDLVVNNREKDRLVEIAQRELNLHVMPELATLPGESSLLARGRQRAFIKVQDGCRYQCTFCIVTVARGEERSRSVAEVVDEINVLHSQGIQEAVLTGVHIGGYGGDNGSSLVELVETVLKQTELPRLRLGAVEPWDLPETFWTLFDNPRFMPHLHLPLQSGADTVLRRMGRRCGASEFEFLVNRARRHQPDFNITTDIIAGFPGESDAEWRETMEYVERIGFGHLHIFAYSPRPGTRAVNLPNPVAHEIIRERSRELHELGERLKRQALERCIGLEYPVLIEGNDEGAETLLSGYTPHFLRVQLDQCDKGLINSIHPVRLGHLTETGDALMATLREN